jgi:CrcB protein
VPRGWLDAADQPILGSGRRSSLVTYVLILLGAAAGAPLRFFVQGRVQDASGALFPWGTLAVNISGCLAIGILATLADERGIIGRDARILLLIGFLGSYTTFSTFGYETLNLLRDNDVPRALWNVGLSTVGGILAVWAGSQFVRWMVP